MTLPSIERLLESADADTTASVWLPVGKARPAIMAELCRFQLPTILCARKDNARALALAACLQAEYPNVRGVAPYPFRNAVQKKICLTLLEKIRNAQTLALFLRDIEITGDNNGFSRIQDSQTNELLGALLYAEARSNYTALVFAERRPNALALGNGCREEIRAASLGKLLNAQDLPLVRVHKSFAVNPAVVREVSLSASGRDYDITLANGKKIPLSRPYRRILERLPAPIVAGGG